MAGRSSRSPIMKPDCTTSTMLPGGLAVARHFGDGLMQVGIELAVSVSTGLTP